MNSAPFIAIACGGTGGHLFPGLAIGRALLERGCSVALLVSSKEVDQAASSGIADLEVVTLRMEAHSAGKVKFIRGLYRSYQDARALFKKRPPGAVLGMGSFTSVGPILAGKRSGARTFLHEANALPGRANRTLAPLVNGVFVGFPEAKAKLQNRWVDVTGTPLRDEILLGDAESARMALGLDPKRPTILVMGGSQGSRAINELVLQTAPRLVQRWPQLQFIHLAGAQNVDAARAIYKELGARAVVAPFLTEVNLALNAATVCIARSGASSLAEFAAVGLPAILIPLPTAADDHQSFNAHAYVKTGAALSLHQRDATPERLVSKLVGLIESEDARTHMRRELERWHAPNAAQVVADKLLRAIGWAPPERAEEELPFEIPSELLRKRLQERTPKSQTAGVALSA